MANEATEDRNELPREEAERRAREVAQRMLTTPKPRPVSQKGDDSVHHELVATKAQLRAELEEAQRELAIAGTPAATKRLREKVRDLRRTLSTG